MPFIALAIGIVLIVVAWNGTHGQLADALKQDIPGFFKWGAAITAILALGYIPGFEKPSRWLLAIVLLVLLLTHYQEILSGVTQFAQVAPTDTGAGAVAPTPSAVVGANPAATAIPVSSVSGDAPNPPRSNVVQPFNPLTYINAFTPEIGFGGTPATQVTG